MSFSDRFIKVFKSVLPSPFTIALILSVVTYVLGVSLNELPEAKIVTDQTEFFTPESITLTASEGQSWKWSPTNETTQSISVHPDSAVTYTVELTSKRGKFSNKASIKVEPANGKMVVSPLADPASKPDSKYLQAIRFWENGLWTSGFLAFLVQMMLMLVLGHVLALTKPVNKLILKLASFCRDTATAVVIVSMLTILVSFLNWGLALIFGAILARKVGEYAKSHHIPLNYGMVGAAGYSGLMTWHGGLSGSALIKVAEEGHLKKLMDGILNESQLNALPTSIPMSETFGSNMNLIVMAALITLVPLSMYLLAKNARADLISLPSGASDFESVNETTEKITGAERLDYWKWPAYLVGGAIVLYACFRAVESGLAVLNPNYINMTLIGLGLIFHSSIARFLKATQAAIGGSTGILIQFPLYFGIMAIMNNTGLVHVFSDFFVKHSSPESFPLLTFTSAGIVNIFVPSGGGQWGVQGPMILKAATDLGVSYPKSIMALAYGDQITNMLQPFWALPLLGITGLKARNILPYTLFLFLIGTAIFITALMAF